MTKKLENTLEKEIPTENNTNIDHSCSTNENKSDINHSVHSKKHFYILLVCIIFFILILLIIFNTVFALFNMGNNKIISGIKINGIDISDLSTQEASLKLSEQLSAKLENPLTLSYQDYQTTIVPSEDFDAHYDFSSIIEEAYLIGRSGNIFKSNFQIISSFLFSRELDVDLQYNNEKLSNIINNISLEIPGLIKQPSYYIENNELIILKGKEGVSLLYDETQNLIISTLEDISSSYSISLPVESAMPAGIDIQKIYNEVHTEPKNAYIVKDPFELNLGSSGVDFAITFEEIDSLLQEQKDEYVIPLKIIEPEIGIDDLGDEIFIDTLSTYSTKYDVSNKNRSTNVELATAKLNNVVILPGQTFSYNQTVGERTIKNGFKEASIYTSSGIEYGLGGGICQVSSTLYNTVLEANLDIVERKNHRYSVTYVPLGKDATVAYGSIDFKFKNTRKYPIKLIASAKNGVVNISIKGIKEEIEYDVTISAQKLQTTPFETKYINDNSLPVGTQVVKQYGYYGYKYETYKILSLNGAVVSKTLISTDIYTPLTKIIRVGTKQ